MKLLEKLGLQDVFGKKEWKDVEVIQDPRKVVGFEGERNIRVRSSGHSKRQVVESLQRKAYLLGVDKIGIKYVTSSPGMPDRLRSHDRYYGEAIA